MASKYNLQIKTPDELIFTGDVEYVIVEHPSGKEGYLAHHESVVKPFDGHLEYWLNGPSSAKSFSQCSGWFIFADNRAIAFLKSKPTDLSD